MWTGRLLDRFPEGDNDQSGRMIYRHEAEQIDDSMDILLAALKAVHSGCPCSAKGCKEICDLDLPAQHTLIEEMKR